MYRIISLQKDSLNEYYLEECVLYQYEWKETKGGGVNEMIGEFESRVGKFDCKCWKVGSG